MRNTLTDWLIHLESLHPKTIELGLARVRKVGQRLNLDPDFLIITVGGTNGKGSVCAMLESILCAAGYSVGCYTSPHLLRYNERVRINKKQASDETLCASFESVEQARKSQQPDSRFCGETGELPACSVNGDLSEIPLTYFEFGTLAAMQCFIKHKVEVAILEVGLGGRLDAVNIFDSDCSVVTAVDIDHTDYLGETREQIAFEKAGIFRCGKVAICADADAPQAITDQAEKMRALLWKIGRDFFFAEQKTNQWSYRSVIGTRNSLPYPALRGAFQLHNASAALAVLDALKERLPVSMDAVRRGLLGVQLPGRFHVVPGRPQLILDVAHNPQAARSLAQNLAGLMPCPPHTYAVFAMLKDKDMASVVAALDSHIDTWLVAGIAVSRGAAAEDLAQVLRQCGVRGKIKVFQRIAEALSYAYNAADENDRIVAFGSFHTVAEVMSVKGFQVL